MQIAIRSALAANDTQTLLDQHHKARQAGRITLPIEFSCAFTVIEDL
jgi:hypothetical protein